MQQLEDVGKEIAVESYILGDKWSMTLNSYVYQVEHILALIHILCGVLCLFQWEILS